MYLKFDNYKRIFSFGCSFTSYHYPTWADIIASESPHARHYNLGRTGAGNVNISCRIAEAHNIFNFNENDLILVMWSSYTREDRWVNNSWVTVGNVYNNNVYGKDFTDKYSDTVGYLIRDLGIIYNTHSMLDYLTCDSLRLFSYPVKQESAEIIFENTKKYEQITNTYKKFIENNIKNTLMGTLEDMYPKLKEVGHEYQNFWNNEITKDPHPNTMNYYNYLKTLNLNLTDKSKIYAENSYQKLLPLKKQQDIHDAFKELIDRIDESYALLI